MFEIYGVIVNGDKTKEVRLSHNGPEFLVDLYNHETKVYEKNSVFNSFEEAYNLFLSLGASIILDTMKYGEVSENDK